MAENASVRFHLNFAGAGQAFLVATGSQGEEAEVAAEVAYREIAQVLRDRGLTSVQERVFGSLGVKQQVMAARTMALQSQGLDPESLLTYIQGHPPWGPGLSGIIIHAVTSQAVFIIRDQGQPVGRSWRQGGARFLLLQDLQGLAGNDRSRQVQHMIQKASHLLSAQRATYQDVVRTWFYLEDILTWYPEFNQARSAMYQEFGLMPAHDGGPCGLPASTGIGGAVATGAAGTLDLLAVTGPLESRPQVRRLSSPAQSEAITYGSAFSRGVSLRHSDFSLIQVSGTAAIDEQGRSLYPGDVRAQIDSTLDKIEALIRQEGASLMDIAAACVFVKRPEDARAYQELAAARGLENLPAVVMVADICRPELLFEMDAEVALKGYQQDLPSRP